MDGLIFDDFTRRFGQAMPRRTVAGLLVALGLGGTGSGPRKAAARKKKKNKKKKKKKGCTNGAVKCGNGCVDTQTNAAHCGGCGRGCDSGQACSGGTCQTGGCPSDHELCGGDCVNTQTDVLHCGSCGNDCVPGQSCQNGQCTDHCDPGELFCANLELCIPDVDPNRCCVENDCGGNPFGDLVCTAEGHCVCADPNEGRCSSATVPSRNFLCDVCCPGGVGCPQGFVCNTQPNILRCDCDLEGGYRVCSGGGECVFVMGSDPLHCGPSCQICCHTPEDCAASGKICDLGVCCITNDHQCLANEDCCSGLCENAECTPCSSAQDCNVIGQSCVGNRCCVASDGPCFGQERTNICCSGQCNVQTSRCV